MRDYIYFVPGEMEWDVAIDLLIISDKYMFTELKEICENILISKLDPHNCFQLILMDPFILTEASREKILDWIVQNISKVHPVQDLSLLPKEILVELVIRLAC